jgi:hypothetical protein
VILNWSQCAASVLLLTAGVLAAPLAMAQTPAPEGAADARIHAGPLALDPRLAVQNVGVDTNVFNDASGGTRDATASVGPELDAWLRAGRLDLVSSSSAMWNYFRKSTGQRSFDFSQAGRADVALGYVTPHIEASLEETRQRPNLEIDARARRRTTAAGGGFTAHVGARLSIDAVRSERRIRFDDAGLADPLNRREVQTTLETVYILTPLTSFVVRAGAQQDRFEHSPIRDTDSILVLPGLQFKPLALISGNAFVGFRRFAPKSTDVPGFRGVVADVDLRYLIRDLTSLRIGVARDLDYSYEATEPYYVSTGVTATVTQALGAAWDVVGRAGATRLDYRGFIGTPVPGGPARRDHVDVYGIGIGRHLGTDVRVGLDVNHVARRSTLEARAYEGVRVGGSVTYGF